MSFQIRLGILPGKENTMSKDSSLMTPIRREGNAPQRRYSINELEQWAFLNAVYSTAEFNDIEINSPADYSELVDALVDIAERLHYAFDENGDKL